ncbi:Copia protein, partial [Mucuna pruriens]
MKHTRRKLNYDYPNVEWNEFQGLKGSRSDSTRLYEFDLVLQVEKPILTLDNLQEVEIEKWKHSSRMCLMIMKRLISEEFWGFILRVKGRENIREYIMEMSNLAEKFKLVKLELGEDLIEERLQRAKTKSAHFALTSQNKKRKNIKGVAEGFMEWITNFITFIDDYSKYDYLSLINEKSLDIFKSFKLKLNFNLERKLKPSNLIVVVNTMVDMTECGIILQYIMPDKPSMNGVAERRNWTLKDMILFETGNARILEEVEFGKEGNIRTIVFEEEFVNNIGQVLMPIIVQETTPVIRDNVQTIVPDIVLEQDYDETLPQTPIEQPQQPQEMSLRRSIKERRHAIPDDYIVFLQENEDGIGLIEDDLINFYQTMQSSNSQKWIDAMKDELESMQDNDVWDLVNYLKARLLDKGFTQKEGIDYKETFSSVSSKDSFRIVMTLVAHFDLELHQMDVKTVFINGDINETIYMMQPKNFVSNQSKSMRFDMKDSKPGDIPIAKADRFSLKYLSDLGMQHWKAIKRVMCYLRRTKGHMVTYQKFEDLEIIRFFDSDFAECQDSKRSTSGYIYMLTRGAISWKFVKRTLIAPSTMVVEFVACFEASDHGIWLRTFVTSLLVVDGIERPLKIYCDNNSAVLYFNNNKSSTKSKFIDINFLIVKERVQNKQISIKYIGTSFMLAYPLTKALIPKK